MALVNHGVLPVAGGVLDQPETLWRDMMLFLNLMYARVEELRPETNMDQDYDADDPRTWFKPSDDEQNVRLGLW